MAFSAAEDFVLVFFTFVPFPQCHPSRHTRIFPAKFRLVTIFKYYL